MEHSEVELLGWDAARCGDLVLLGDGDALAAAAGPAVLLAPLSGAAAPARRLRVRDGFGIGALAADAKRQHLAVLEKSCSSRDIAAKPNMCVLHARREEERGSQFVATTPFGSTRHFELCSFLPPPHTTIHTQIRVRVAITRAGGDVGRRQRISRQRLHCSSL